MINKVIFIFAAMCCICCMSCLSIDHTADQYYKLLAETDRESDVIQLEVDPLNNGYINRITLKGTHYDYGYRIGLMSRKTVIHPKMITSSNRDLNDQIIEMYKEIYPPYLEILRGIADAYNVNPEDLDMRDLEWRFFVEFGWISLGFLEMENSPVPMINNGCSIAAYQIPETGEVLVGRNFDWRMHNGTIISTALGQDYRVAGNTIINPEGWIMDGINEHGLFIGVMTVASPPTEFVENQEYPGFPAIDAHHLMKIIINTCKTVQEAEELARKVRVYFGSETIHYLLADPAGDMAVFEFDMLGNLKVIRSDTHYLLSTNFRLYDSSLDDKMLCHRYALGDNLLRTEDVKNERDLFNLVSRMSPNRESPLESSDYFPYKSYLDMGVWTSIYHLNRKTGFTRFWKTQNPEFVPVEIPY